MTRPPGDHRRTVGLLGAIGVGVGAIVGGGILVLAGVAFESTGPAAVVAFALNGVVAFLTALSFAEIATTFPESGGAYTFAKKVLSLRSAFAAGWILWFAYIVAAALYALGFAYYGILLVQGIAASYWGDELEWLADRRVLLFLGGFATLAYAANHMRRAAGGKSWTTAGKLVVFALLLVFGFLAVAEQPVDTTLAALDPFFSGGFAGLIAAMGFTFIALQGFEIIAAVAGEIRSPRRNIPRAMFLSLAIALTVYLPLLFVVAAVGAPADSSIAEAARANPETVMAGAVERFMGSAGFWLVVVAAILSTLSALNANILAASRVALSMAKDRTLPDVLSRESANRGTPVFAIGTSALVIVVLLAMVPDLAAAGAAASLVFLVVFTLTHWTTFLARKRGGGRVAAFRMPLYPLIPIVGGIACASLALFQAIATPAAGVIVLIWLATGVLFYFAIFAPRARVLDASSEALNPDLIRMRGRTPLVLLPIANPAHTAPLVAVANAMSPPHVGRVLLLTIIRDPKNGSLTGLHDAQSVVRDALTHSVASGHRPEVLMTLSPAPWAEIQRVARDYQCESLLLGMNPNTEATSQVRLEKLVRQVDCDVAILRAPTDWRLEETRRILVPIGGRGVQHALRARFLGSLGRSHHPQITFLRVVPVASDENTIDDVRNDVLRQSEDTVPGQHRVEIVFNDNPVDAIVEVAADYDAVILGLRQTRQGVRFGGLARRIAEHSPCATILLSAKN